MSNVNQQLSLATLDSSSYSNIKVFVKLISGSYLQDVQEHLATMDWLTGCIVLQR